MDSFIKPYDILLVELDLSVIQGNLVFLLHLFCYFTLQIVLSRALTFLVFHKELDADSCLRTYSNLTASTCYLCNELL